MGIALRPGVSFCDVGGRLVFLDIEADRYFALSPHVEAAFRALMEGAAPGPALPSALLVTDTRGPSRPEVFRCPNMAEASLLDRPYAPYHTMDVVIALACLMHTRRALRAGRLSRLLKDLASAKARLPAAEIGKHAALCRLSAAFEQTSRLVRSHDQCLPRSIALARLCLWRGVPVDLVIGVKLRPFAAHSWVQSGRWLVNDRGDNVRCYTPVLAV